MTRATALTWRDQPTPFTVKIICTDKGQHKRYGLARAIWDPSQGEDGEMRLTHGAVGPWQPPGGFRFPGSPDADPDLPRDAYVFWCPGCNRTPQIKHAKFWQMVEDFVRVRFPLLDISELPF